ncbi:MAG TPA: hypothetical protein VIK18_25870, partial [Pirellulales bacterium]
AADAKELLALGELCIFGQQFGPAHATLEKYLALPQPPERKLALVLLVRALLGMNQPGLAEVQIQSLLNDYAYDAQTHYAIDQVIDAAEGTNSFNKTALALCAAQNAATLPLLASGKALQGKEISAAPSVLFADAVRCAALAAELEPVPEAGQDATQDTMQQLAAIARQPSWAGTADFAPMQSALARQVMVGRRAPLALHGHVLSQCRLVPRALPLTRGRVLLLPFTLWAPSSQDAARQLAVLAPWQPIYAITSWRANTGGADTPSSQILEALRQWQQNLPPHVSMLIVPDAELNVLHADVFPAGVAIRDGIVRSNTVLSSRGSERMLLRALGEGAGKPETRRASAESALR